MSNFVVSARKYRPVRFDEVVGQEHVSQTLKNALQNNKLAHAFLFCGPRGVGKTTCARILAKVLNCQNLSDDHEACNTCASCQSFNDNASFNITELDAASNNSVDHIRALIEQVRFQPQQGQYKVFIIDEVHMLSQQAFNAFLKTLEEPPPYAIFILATTEKHKIIPTILSRCQIFDFRRIQVPAMVTHLQEICKQENITAEKDALHIIGQKADGALRDSLSIFDRIVSSLTIDKDGKRTLTYKSVIESLNVLDYDYFFKVVDALLVEDMAKVMVVFDDVLRKGFEEDTFVMGLAEHMRNLLVCKDEQTLGLLQVSDELKALYKTQAEKAPASFLLTALDIGNDCDVNYRMARNKRLHVEMALIKMAYINRAVAAFKRAPVVAERRAVAAPTATTTVSQAKPNIEKKEVTYQASIPVENVREPEAPLNPPGQEEKKVTTPSPVAKPVDMPAVQNLNPEVQTGSVMKMPKLPSLDELENEVDKEASQHINQENLTHEDVEAAWMSFLNQMKSQSVKVALKRVAFQVDGSNIIVSVGSRMSKSMIQEELELMPFLRKKLRNSKLVLNVEVDPKMAPQDMTKKPKRPINDKDKYHQMREINPLLDDFRARFDLRLEGE